jgi:hypothetical protein
MPFPLLALTVHSTFFITEMYILSRLTNKDCHNCMSLDLLPSLGTTREYLLEVKHTYLASDDSKVGYHQWQERERE